MDEPTIAEIKLRADRARVDEEVAFGRDARGIIYGLCHRVEAAESRATELESALRATIEAHGFCDDEGCTFAIARALLPPVPVQEEEQ